MTNTPTNSVGRALRARRKELGLSQEALATKSCVSRPTISSIEKGGPFTGTVIDLLCIAMDCTYEMLIIPKAKK